MEALLLAWNKHIIFPINVIVGENIDAVLYNHRHWFQYWLKIPNRNYFAISFLNIIAHVDILTSIAAINSYGTAFSSNYHNTSKPTDSWFPNICRFASVLSDSGYNSGSVFEFVPLAEYVSQFKKVEFFLPFFVNSSSDEFELCSSWYCDRLLWHHHLRSPHQLFS